MAFAPYPPLGPGAHLRIVAPSSPFDEAALRRGVARLRARYRVSYAPGLFERQGFLAGDDARRASELLEALTDSSVDALVAARGGYGATRLLEAMTGEPSDPVEASAKAGEGALTVDLVRAAGKPLVGFSDITALHALWRRAGLRSLHAPMAARLADLPEPAFARWVRALEGEPPSPLEGLSTIAPGRAEGRLFGGNLTVLAALGGADFAPELEGAILFLEDVGEAPYRVDRALTTLRASGALRGVAGVALGAFTGATPGPDGTGVGDVLRERLGGLGVPVVEGVPAGHVDDNLPLPLGARVKLDADAGTLRFHEGLSA